MAAAEPWSSGCLAQRYADRFAEEMPEVDYFLGTAEYAKISEVLERAGDMPRRIVSDPDLRSDLRRPTQPTRCRGTRRTSRSPRAARTNVRSASSRRFAGAKQPRD